MENLVFLEASLNSEGASTFAETHAKLIEFATAEVDSLVAEAADFVASNPGTIIESDLDATYESVEDPISDMVITATSVFGDVISEESLSETDKIALIESYAHMIAMGDEELVAEAFDPTTVAGQAGMSLQAHHNAITGKLGNVGGDAALGAVAGAAGGAAVGAGVAGIAKLFSKERKAWKTLVKQEKEARKKGANKATIDKIMKAKEKAKIAYKKARNASLKKGAAVGGVVGAAGGAMAGAVHGAQSDAAVAGEKADASTAKADQAYKQSQMLKHPYDRNFS